MRVCYWRAPAAHHRRDLSRQLPSGIPAAPFRAPRFGKCRLQRVFVCAVCGAPAHGEASFLAGKQQGGVLGALDSDPDCLAMGGWVIRIVQHSMLSKVHVYKTLGPPLIKSPCLFPGQSAEVFDAHKGPQ